MSQLVMARGGPGAQEVEINTAFAVTLMEHLVVPTFVLDATQKVLVWNKACERLTGVKAVDVIGTREHWRAFYESPRPCLADLLASGDWTAIGKLYTTHEDPTTPAFGVHAENWCVMPCRGRRVYLAVDAGPVFDEAGHLIAVVETLRDITESKLAQAKVLEQASLLKVHYEEHQREAELAQRILGRQIRVDQMDQAGVKHSVNPASNFSGDMVLAARSPDGRLYALLADATGHGLAAAVSVLPIVQEFYRQVELARPLLSIVDSLNFLLANSLPTGRFVAAAFVCVDEPQQRGEIWVGGIPDVLMVDQAGQVVQTFPSQHLPLGVSKHVTDVGTSTPFYWKQPCRLLLYSDGVVEASNAEGELFGQERLLAALSRASEEAIIETIEADLRTHLQTQAAHDDMSLLVLECPVAARP